MKVSLGVTYDLRNLETMVLFELLHHTSYHQLSYLTSLGTLLTLLHWSHFLSGLCQSLTCSQFTVHLNEN